MPKLSARIPRRVLINLFILLNLSAIFLRNSPPAYAKDLLSHYLQPYLYLTGLEQNWKMYAPEINAVNFDFVGRVTFQDGTQRLWPFPQMANLPVWRRFFKGRRIEWVGRVCNYKPFLPDLARYIARLYHTKEEVPARVDIVFHWSTIPPPIEGQDHQPIPARFPHSGEVVHYAYRVVQEDLLNKDRPPVFSPPTGSGN